MLDIRPLTLVLRIRLSLTILIIAIRIGTAATPLMTAVYTSALIGSMLEKFIESNYRRCSYYQVSLEL